MDTARELSIQAAALSSILGERRDGATLVSREFLAQCADLMREAAALIQREAA